MHKSLHLIQPPFKPHNGSKLQLKQQPPKIQNAITGKKNLSSDNRVDKRLNVVYVVPNMLAPDLIGYEKTKYSVSIRLCF